MLTQREQECRGAIMDAVLAVRLHPEQLMESIRGYSFEEVQVQVSNMLAEHELVLTSDLYLEAVVDADDRFWRAYKQARPYLLGEQ